MTAATSGSARAGNDPRPVVYVGGDPSLDLVNTVDWVGDGQENERLTSYERFLAWSEGAGVVSPKEVEALRQRSRRRRAEAETALERTRELRAVLQRLFHRVAADGASVPAWPELDGWLERALSKLRLQPTSGGGDAVASWSWRGAGEELDAPLWPVVWSAARLLASDEAGRIEVCDGPDCGWVFVDRSRNGMRRWCQMETCGTAAKTRRRRQRQR
jgi:predicted RNA-binding Zn ribbon-like protein